MRKKTAKFVLVEIPDEKEFDMLQKYDCTIQEVSCVVEVLLDKYYFELKGCTGLNGVPYGFMSEWITPVSEELVKEGRRNGL